MVAMQHSPMNVAEVSTQYQACWHSRGSKPQRPECQSEQSEAGFPWANQVVSDMLHSYSRGCDHDRDHSPAELQLACQVEGGGHDIAAVHGQRV